MLKKIDPKLLQLQFKKLREAARMPLLLECAPSSLTFGVGMLRRWQSEVVLHVIALSSGQRAVFQSLFHKLSRHWAIYTWLMVGESERCHEIVFDAVPYKETANMKGRKTNVSVLQCCIVFSFPLTRHSRLCYIFAALKIHTLQAFPWTQWNVIQLSFIIAVTANTMWFCFLFFKRVYKFLPCFDSWKRIFFSLSLLWKTAPCFCLEVIHVVHIR